MPSPYEQRFCREHPESCGDGNLKVNRHPEPGEDEGSFKDISYSPNESDESDESGEEGEYTEVSFDPSNDAATEEHRKVIFAPPPGIR